jgi:carbonic anhydrase
VVQFAVDVLKVKHIMVVGHYGCGGVHAALTGERLGLVDNWIRHVADVADKHTDCLHAFKSDRDKHDRLCELNVLEQVVNLTHTNIVRDAWARGQDLTVHGWVYSLTNGRVNDLGISMNAVGQLAATYAQSLTRIADGCGVT